MRKLTWPLLVLLLSLPACDGGKAPTKSDDDDTGTEQDTRSERERERDRLESLQYAGGSEVEGDDGVERIDKERMQPGYTLYSIHMRSAARLIDEEGNVVNEWSDPDGRHWDNIELLPNGDLITTGADPADVQGIKDEARYAMRLSWDGKVIWKKYLFAHHDIAAAPNDELITLTFQRRSEASVHKQIDLRDDLITRLNMDGDEIESVSLWDNLPKTPDLYPLNKKSPTSMGGERWIDLFHCNSVEWMDDAKLADENPIYAPTNVLFCSRHQDRIAIMNMDEKKIVWAWGRDELDGPHDATVLDDGNILVFDNGLARGWSRVVELDPRTNEIAWQYFVPRDKERAEAARNARDRTDENQRSFYTKSKGSNQRLANGNTLICNSDQGEIFEVTPDGDVVWRYVAPERVDRKGRELRAAYVRAYRYPKDFIEQFLEK